MVFVVILSATEGCGIGSFSLNRDILFGVAKSLAMNSCCEGCGVRPSFSFNE